MLQLAEKVWRATGYADVRPSEQDFIEFLALGRTKTEIEARTGRTWNPARTWVRKRGYDIVLKDGRFFLV